jgi:hypothetical protein
MNSLYPPPLYPSYLLQKERPMEEAKPRKNSPMKTAPGTTRCECPDTTPAWISRELALTETKFSAGVSRKRDSDYRLSSVALAAVSRPRSLVSVTMFSDTDEGDFSSLGALDRNRTPLSSPTPERWMACLTDEAEGAKLLENVDLAELVPACCHARCSAYISSAREPGLNIAAVGSHQIAPPRDVKTQRRLTALACGMPAPALPVTIIAAQLCLEIAYQSAAYSALAFIHNLSS